jgi:hypothetical protein
MCGDTTTATDPIQLDLEDPTDEDFEHQGGSDGRF